MKKFHTTEPQGTHLEWVPTWEGVLKYCPDDLKNDVPLRFWHCFYHRGFKRKVCFELAISFNQNQNGKKRCKPRRKIVIKHRGKLLNLQCAQLTYLCVFGFRPVDTRHWVVDHINNNSMDDRPSNLQLISQKENTIRSSKVQEMKNLAPKQKKQFRAERQAKIAELRSHIIAAMGPGATRIDVEVELALQLQRLEGGEPQ